MCAVTVVLLVQQRARYRRNFPMRGVAGSVRDFNQEFRKLTRADRASLATLGEFEGRESATPENIIDNDPPIAHPLSDPVQERGHAEESGCDVSVSSTGDRYKEVKRLADLGLDKDEIFERVGLPKREIELVLKVSRLRAGAGRDVRTGHSFLV